MRRALLATAAAVAMAATLVAPATPAAADTSALGEQLSVLFPPATYDADTPFHFRHGWCATDRASVRGVRHPSTTVELRHNGDLVPSQIQRRPGPDEEGCVAVQFHVFGFPAGLPAGSHTFEVRWYWLGDLHHSATATILFLPATVGESISMAVPPATFPADTPFHVKGGFCFLEGTDPGVPGHPDTRFDLHHNGVQLVGVRDHRTGDDADEGCIAVTFYIFNFPDGLPAGPHDFEAFWWLAGDLFHSNAPTIDFTG
jgi:hypothetical protein